MINDTITGHAARADLGADVRVMVCCGDWICQQALLGALFAAAGVELVLEDAEGGTPPNPHVDVVLTDLPGTPSLTGVLLRMREVRRLCPRARVLLVDVAEGVVIDQLPELGVAGCFHHGDLLDGSQLVAAARAAAKGLFVTPLARLQDAQSPPRQKALIDIYGLSRVEAEVLGLLADGLTNKEIAARTHYALQTVKNTVSTCFRKLGVHRREDAARLARRTEREDKLRSEGFLSRENQ